MGQGSTWQIYANLHDPLKCHFRPRNPKIWDCTRVMPRYGSEWSDRRVMYTCHSILTFPHNSMWSHTFNTSPRSHSLGSFGLREPKHAHELLRKHATKWFRSHISWHFCCRTMVQGGQFSLHSVSNEMIRDCSINTPRRAGVYAQSG